MYSQIAMAELKKIQKLGWRLAAPQEQGVAWEFVDANGQPAVWWVVKVEVPEQKE